jgi:hypothetical protein
MKDVPPTPLSLYIKVAKQKTLLHYEVNLVGVVHEKA